VQSVTDATNAVVATNTYDALGRTICVTDAAGHATRSTYNFRDQLVHQWGDGTFPVEYGYTPPANQPDYGERTSMRTFRGGTGWAGATWPTGTTGTADTTTWAFDPGTGLLTAKTTPATQDAAGNVVPAATVTQTYNARGQTATRTLARGVTTTYTYDGLTGELLNQEFRREFRRGQVLSISIDGPGTGKKGQVLSLSVARRRQRSQCSREFRRGNSEGVRF